MDLEATLRTNKNKNKNPTAAKVIVLTVGFEASTKNLVFYLRT